MIFYVIDTETGPGVLETALAYTSALRMADNAILFKYTAKSVGMKHGIIPSFMAKPWNGVGLPHSSRKSDLYNKALIVIASWLQWVSSSVFQVVSGFLLTQCLVISMFPWEIKREEISLRCQGANSRADASMQQTMTPSSLAKKQNGSSLEFWMELLTVSDIVSFLLDP